MKSYSLTLRASTPAALLPGCSRLRTTLCHGSTYSGTCEGYESDCELGLELISNPEEVECGNVPNLVDCSSELCCQERELVGFSRRARVVFRGLELKHVFIRRSAWKSEAGLSNSPRYMVLGSVRPPPRL